jgi:hypothetical protein
VVTINCAPLTARPSRSQHLIARAADAAAASDEPVRSVDGMAKAIGGAQVNKQSVLVVGATGTLGRQVGYVEHHGTLVA